MNNKIINSFECYIDYMNKDNNFKRSRKDFYSYAEAVKWGKQNLENFNSDLINFY